MSAGLYLRELGAYLGRFRDRCQQKRWAGAEFHVGVANRIQQDLGAAHCVLSAAAHSAAVHDEEAIDVLRAALGDGLTAEDLPAIEKAIRLVKLSAAMDRQISEATS